MDNIDKFLQETEGLTLNEFKKIYLVDPRLCKFIVFPKQKKVVFTRDILFRFLLTYYNGLRTKGLVILNDVLPVDRVHFYTHLVGGEDGDPIEFLQLSLNWIVKHPLEFDREWADSVASDPDLLNKWTRFLLSQESE